MDRISTTIQNLPKKQRIGLLALFILIVLLGIAITAVPKSTENRPKAAGIISQSSEYNAIKQQGLRIIPRLYTKLSGPSENSTGSATATYNTLSTILPAAATSETISDNFDDNNLNLNRWGKGIGSDPYDANVGKIEAINGKVRSELFNRAISKWTTLGLLKELTGDFVATVDMTIESGGWPSGANTALIFHNNDWTNQLGIYLQKTSETTADLVAAGDFNNQWKGWGRKSVVGFGPFKVRLTRVGNEVFFEYLEGDTTNLIAHPTADVYLGDGMLDLHIGSWTNFPPVVSTYDNFEAKVNYASCYTFPKDGKITDVFSGNDLNTQMWNSYTNTTGSVTQSNGVLGVQTDGTDRSSEAGVFTKKRICGDFDVSTEISQFTHGIGDAAVATLLFANWQASSVAYIELASGKNSQWIGTNVHKNNVIQEGQGIPLSGTSGKLRIKRSGSVISSYYDTGEGWILLKSFPDGFIYDGFIQLRTGSWDPDRPSVSANFDNFLLTGVTPDPTFTPVPSITLTPTATPLPTPPSGQDKYTIDVGDKQFLTFNIAPGQTPQIRFKALLSFLQNKPQMYLKLRVKDELAFMKNPSVENGSDSCNNPPEGSKDFNIPAQADGDVYKPVQDINGSPPGGGKAAKVSVDGWVSLDGVIPGRYYTLLLKGPKTRSVKVAEHVLIQPNQNTEIQDFDWTSKPIDPGDLPDPNNGLKQDCTVNSIDLSLITSRLGAMDGDNLNIGDVNYDGIINGNDVSKVVNTLSTKPDDDL